MNGRLERKTNLFYEEYLPEIREQIELLKEKNIDVSELEKMADSLEEQIRVKDYLAADQIIELLVEELEKKKLEAGIFDRPGFSFL